MCGTDGLQAHASGLGIVMAHDTKSVRCVLALESAFLRPRGPSTEVPALRQPVFMLVDTFLDACT